MPDKCEAHDACIGRIHDTLDEIRDEIRKGNDEVRGLLHEGALVHTRHEMRIAQCEEKIGTSGTDWKGLFVRLGFGLLEKGVILVLGMAYWAHMNGFGK